MTREEIIAELEELARDGDIERAHYLADDLLTDLLNQLGYEDVVKAFDAIDKWYA